MSRQTAVEWLYERLERMIPRTALYNTDKKIYFDQAKQMEREQIVEACNSQKNDYRGMPTYNKSGEQYYNETYGSQNEYGDYK